MGTDLKQATTPVLTNEEIDAIGEILNISMGSAATAISTMLDKQVVITTPKVCVEEFINVDYAMLEPAMLVKIKYVEGISGSNVMVFRQSDMQIILNLLMGNEEPPSEEFVFDELSMSAACEVMNQMMGASATALSEFLGKTINISTPIATILDSEHTFRKSMEVEDEEQIVSIAFNLNIEGVMNSDFISIMSCELARMIVNQVMGAQDEQLEAIPAAEPAPAPSAPPPAAPPPSQPQPQAPAAAAVPGGQGVPPQQGAMPPAGMPGQQQGVPPMGGQPPMYDPATSQPYMPQMPYGYPMYPGMYPPYGYPMPQQAPQDPAQGGGGNVMKQAVNVQTAQFPSFTNQAPGTGAPLAKANMDLVMNVPLSVSVEIGKTKKKIREIMEFNQGTVIELEKQAGAPVDIVVNGQLIARGDVVVIDDNFAVRISEIVNTKDLVESINHR